MRAIARGKSHESAGYDAMKNIVHRGGSIRPRTLAQEVKPRMKVPAFISKVGKIRDRLDPKTGVTPSLRKVADIATTYPRFHRRSQDGAIAVQPRKWVNGGKGSTGLC